MDAFRAQLDELMGADRNLADSAKSKKKSHFSDSKFCKNFLCGLCPNLLFTNLKCDLGK